MNAEYTCHWSKKIERGIFVVYLGLFVIMAVVMAVYQPFHDLVSEIPLSPPDEHNRYLIPYFIYQHGYLPTGLEEEVRIQGCGFSYGLYNTLPYILQGLLMRITGLFTSSEMALVVAARFVNVIFGVLSCIVVYLLGLCLFRDDRFRWVFCFAVMYLPEHLFVYTYVNTDACCMFSTALILFALVSAYQDTFRWKNCVLLALGIILCALSYYNAYGYILCSVFLFLAFYLHKGQEGWSYDWKNMLRYGLFISVIVLAGAGWWYVRTYIILDGDFLGLRTKEELALKYAVWETSPLNTYYAKGISIWQMLKENEFFQCLYDSFIAVFGSLTIRGNFWTYFSYKLFFGAGILGLLLGYILQPCILRKPAKEWFFHFNMFLCILLPLVVLIRYAYTMNYQHQGRYVLPSLIPLMYYIVLGIQRLAGIRWKNYQMPSVLVNAGVLFAFFIASGSAVYMVFFKSMPIFIEFIRLT